MPKPKLGDGVKILLGVVLVCGVCFVAAYSYLAPSPRDLDQVAFTDFLSQVHDGSVDEITIRGEREYIFRARSKAGSHVVKTTMGPKVSDDLVASLRPTDDRLAPPKIRFED